MAGPGDSAGQGQGREAPGPAVRGQQRAALGLQEKLRGVGSRAAFGLGSLLGRVRAPGWKQEGKESWEEREGRETLEVAGVGSWIRDPPPHHRDEGNPHREGVPECAGLLHLGQ